jgi:hypothetical protein
VPVLIGINGPFKALRAVKGNDLNGVAFGVDQSFNVGGAVSPFPCEIEDELL